MVVGNIDARKSLESHGSVLPNRIYPLVIDGGNTASDTEASLHNDASKYSAPNKKKGNQMTRNPAKVNKIPMQQCYDTFYLSFKKRS